MSDSISEVSSRLKDRYGLTRLGSLGNSLGGMGVGISASREGSSLDCLCLTSTPSAVQDVVSPYLLSILNFLPQSLVRRGTILFDRIISKFNEEYLFKTHSHFYSEGKGYPSYAQLGATKISDIQGTVQSLRNAPWLSHSIKGVKQPVLFVYGGEDSLLGIKNGNPPREIYDLYSQAGSSEKGLSIYLNANHCLNASFKMDKCFNEDPEYSAAKSEILDHFRKHLL